ncbi:MAG: DUF4070 domain-containing protein [Chloroflexi bacterium]|nr:DUF4070 domain-containing protein [Chloroflexota bacterium]
MRACLVYPEIPNTFWSMKHILKVIGKKALLPPLGLLTVAAMLPDKWEKRLVDLNVNQLTDMDLEWADYVFLSAMSVQEASVREIIVRCRKAGVSVVAGGPLFTNEPEKFEDVDHLVLNEAEITLPQFLVDLERGRLQPVYKTSEYANVHHTPLPQWDLLPDLSHYHQALVQYSRGCPYSYDFCDVISLFGRIPRVKQPEQIIAELNALEDSFDYLFFADDNFIGNKKHLKAQLLPALIEWRRHRGSSITFGTQVTITLADDAQLMELMLEAGFRQIFIGLETPEEESLVASRKRQNTKRDMLENVRRLHKAGFQVSAGFIVGFDTDTTDIFQRQIDFIQESGIVLASTNLLKAPPGTELYERMKREGRLLEEFTFNEIETNFIPQMDPDVLYAGFRNVLQHIFSPEYVYQRAKKFLQEYEPRITITKTGRINYGKHVGTLIRSIYLIGIRSRARYYFWKLLLWTMLTRPKLIRFAVVDAVIMHQLNNLFESHYGTTGQKAKEHGSLEKRELDFLQP